MKNVNIEPYKLSFINKFGALQDVWFFKRSNKQLSTKKEGFKRNTLTANSYAIDQAPDKRTCIKWVLKKWT